MKNKKFLIIIGVVAIMAIFIGVAVNKKPVEVSNIVGEKSATRVEVQTVTLDGSISTKISSSGKLEAVEEKSIYLDSPNKVVKLYKKAGDEVKAGEVIMTLDEETRVKTEKQIEVLQAQLQAAELTLATLTGNNSKQEVLNVQATISSSKDNQQKLQNQVTAQETSLKDLEADLIDAKKALALQEELLGADLGSKQERDDAASTVDTIVKSIDTTKKAIEELKSQIETVKLQQETAQYQLDVLLNKVEDPNKKKSISDAQSQIKSLKTQIETNQMDLSGEVTDIVAPINGIITVAPQEEGMALTAGVAVVTIVDPSRLKIECDISPYYAADLKTDLEALVKYTGSKVVEVHGKVTKVSKVAVSKQTSSGESTVIPVEIEITDPGDILKPGFSADVKVITEKRDNVCIIPLLATMEDEDGMTYVYVVTEDATLEKREVTEGLSDSLSLEVSGLNEGEIIVTNPSSYLQEGMKVSYEKLGDAQ